MNEVAVFNYESQQVRSMVKSDEPWFVLSDVCKVLAINHIKDTVKRLDEDEVGLTEVIDRLGRKQQTYIINESGLYAVILRSDKPQAKPFRKWVTSEVLPSIRKTGGYSVKPADDMLQIQRLQAETDNMNAKTKNAQLLYKIAENTDTDYKKVMFAHITHLLTGEYLLPLPEVNERTYSAAEIGERLGVSANRIGRLANLYGLKTDEYGKYFYDKAKTADKQVETFRYYAKAVDVFRKLVSGVAV